MADREFQRIQFLLTSKFLNPIRDRIIFYGSAMGIIPFDPFDPSIYEGHWQFPAKMSIDAGRDSAAAINEVRAGMRTKASWYAQQGDDADDAEAVIFAEAEAKIESAKELSAKHGIPINTALEMLGNPSTYPIQKLDSGNTL
jgi:hypothetical protein